MDPVSIVGAVGTVLVIATSYGFVSQHFRESGGLDIVRDTEDAKVDIVFVHGLGGDPYESWSSEDGPGVVNWMEDLLPKDVPNARIMTFGYSAKLFAAQNSNTSKLAHIWKRSRSSSDLKTLQNIPQALHLQSNALLEELAKRRADRVSNRPIIFIAHSLGGLIVKGALVQSSASVGERSHYKAIELSTAGALFFGTPQHGSSKAPWDNILTRAASFSLKLPTDQRSDLKTAQAELFDLQVQRYKSVESNFPNYAFLERRTTNLKDIKDYLIPPGIFAPKLNARGRWETIQLEKSHHEMVKYPGSWDPDYRKVRASIEKCISNLNEASKRCSDFYAKLGNFSDQFGMHPLTSIAPPLSSVKSSSSSRSESSLARIEDPEVRTSILKVNSWDKKERQQKAEPEFKKELAKCEEKNGISSPSTLELLKQLARYYVEIKEYPKAEQLFKRLFVVIQDREGPWSLDTAEILQSIADVVTKQGQYAEATEYLFRVEEIQASNYGQFSPEKLSTSASIAIMLDKQEQWSQAEKRYKEVIKFRKDLFGNNDERTLVVMENLALHYRMRGKKMFPESKRLYAEVHMRRKENSENISGANKARDRPLTTGELQQEEEARVLKNSTAQKLACVKEISQRRSLSRLVNG